MNFLVDAQLPPRLARFLRERGHNAVHTDQLPLGNSASDRILRGYADDEKRIVITKDRGFIATFAAGKGPRKLLYVALGNLTNAALIGLFDRNIDVIADLFENDDFLELAYDGITVRG